MFDWSISECAVFKSLCLSFFSKGFSLYICSLEKSHWQVQSSLTGIFFHVEYVFVIFFYNWMRPLIITTIYESTWKILPLEPVWAIIRRIDVMFSLKWIVCYLTQSSHDHDCFNKSGIDKFSVKEFTTFYNSKCIYDTWLLRNQDQWI